MGFWSARGQSVDRRRAGREAERRRAARQSCATAGQLFGGAKRAAKSVIKTVPGLPDTDENSRLDVAGGWGSTKRGKNSGCDQTTASSGAAANAEDPARRARTAKTSCSGVSHRAP